MLLNLSNSCLNKTSGTTKVVEESSLLKLSISIEIHEMPFYYKYPK